MIELTSEQQQALAASGTGSKRAFDPVTQTEYVLVPAEAYEHIRFLLTDDIEWQESAYAAAMKPFARDGWDDPRMDVYDALDPRKNP